MQSIHHETAHFSRPEVEARRSGWGWAASGTKRDEKDIEREDDEAAAEEENEEEAGDDAAIEEADENISTEKPLPSSTTRPAKALPRPGVQ